MSSQCVGNIHWVVRQLRRVTRVLNRTLLLLMVVLNLVLSRSLHLLSNLELTFYLFLVVVIVVLAVLTDLVASNLTVIFH